MRHQPSLHEHALGQRNSADCRAGLHEQPDGSAAIARKRGWLVVSMKNDWRPVYAPAR